MDSRVNNSSALTGIVLAGGLSRRLGRDKTRLRLHDGASDTVSDNTPGTTSGPDMLLRTVELLRSVTGRVCISCRPGQPRQVEGCECIFDEVEGMGPFSGVLSALRKVGGPILALSCDLPFMDRATLESLLQGWQQRHENTLMTTFLQVETGYVEALVAVYEYAALPRFERAVAQGVRKLTDVMPPEFRTTIPYLRHETLPFFNINFPADLENARRMMSGPPSMQRAMAAALRGDA